MIYVENAPEDEVLALREAAHIIRAELLKLERTPVCRELQSLRDDMIDCIGDALTDSCVENLLLRDECYNPHFHTYTPARSLRDVMKSIR